jgi:hypothetical protein
MIGRIPVKTEPCLSLNCMQGTTYKARACHFDHSENQNTQADER